ncbi:MAG TPA: MarR family transcriptional regulator [Rhodospirillaceae bacterium]|nr:MarR family transcriptional regulator [Rhodospirillaceae bacterium]
MTDVKSALDPRRFPEAGLRQGIELLYFAYRAFTAEPDAILAHYGFGRAHHRVIYFIGRQDELTVSELLAVLQISKQSLAPILRQLRQAGLVTQLPGRRDRRQRLLRLTEKGQDLERRLSQTQRSRLAAAYGQAGPSAAEGFRQVMLGLMDPADHQRLVDMAPLESPAK